MYFRELRQNFGTQKQLAEIIGVTQTAVQFWENGKCYPRIKDLRKLAETLHVSIENLLRSFDL